MNKKVHSEWSGINSHGTLKTEIFNKVYSILLDTHLNDKVKKNYAAKVKC